MGVNDREKNLRERISENRTDPDALRELALLIGQARDRKTEAVDVWQRYLDAADAADVSDALLGLGRAQIEARLEVEAIETLRRCTREAPELPEAFETLGSLLHRSGDLEAAAGALRRAAELQPGNVQPLLALLSCLDEMGDSDAAREVLGSAQKIASSDPAVAALIRELLQRRG
jgi:tetratricopeptide (TPR) repeat protein